MFKFKDLSEGNDFNIAEYRLSPREFFEKRRTSKRPYVFDLRSSEAHEAENIPGSHSLPIEHFETSIYQMPFAGDILLYGGEDGEVLTAAEILYDNGFDSFSFTDSYEALFSSANNSYLSITDSAGKQINDKLQSADTLKGVQLIVEPTSPLKANYRLELVESPWKAVFSSRLPEFQSLVNAKMFLILKGQSLKSTKTVICKPETLSCQSVN